MNSFKRAQFIDHTLLKPDATVNQISTLCKEAIKHQFYAVCIHPCYIPLVKKELQGSEVKTCTVVGFPLGANTSEAKIAETLDALEKGADEIDMVINIGAAKDGNWSLIEEEILAISTACHDAKALSKVIIETALLNREEKINAAKACLNSQADFVKTSTGFASGGATIEDVALLKEVVKENLQIKASGGIRDLQSFLAMISAGANRIGTSSGINILTAK